MVSHLQPQTFDVFLDVAMQQNQRGVWVARSIGAGCGGIPKDQQPSAGTQGGIINPCASKMDRLKLWRGQDSRYNRRTSLEQALPKGCDSLCVCCQLERPQ